MRTIFSMNSFFLLCLSLSIGLSACRDSYSNKNIPTAPSELSFKDNSPEGIWRQRKWERLATALHIDNHNVSLEDYTALLGHGSREETSKQLLTEQLMKAPTLITDIDKRDEYLATLSKIKNLWSKDKNQTRCSAVTDFTYLHSAKIKGPDSDVTNLDTFLDLVDEKQLSLAHVYTMDYKLQSNAQGDPEEITRKGFIVIPDNKAKTSPLMVYAHGSDRGLSYLEISQVLGKLQKDHIIIAPTYPGEPLCKGWIDDHELCDHKGMYHPPVGESKPWQNDVDEVLGMHDCVYKALTKKDFSAPKSFKTILNDEAYRVQKSLDYFAGNNPSSMIVGSSRGGLVSMLAISKTGAAYESFTDDLSQINTPYGMPSQFSCVAAISSPSSILVGRLKLILEYLAKGQLKHTQASKLPGINQLEEIFKVYREDRSPIGTPESEAILEKLVLEIFSRDLAILGPYVLAGLKKWSDIEWSEVKPLSQFRPHMGSVLLLHGADDKVVPFEQTKISANILRTIAQTPMVLSKTRTQLTPELNLVFRGFRFRSPAESRDSHQHLDLGFMNSTSFIPYSIHKDHQDSFSFNHNALHRNDDDQDSLFVIRNELTQFAKRSDVYSSEIFERSLAYFSKNEKTMDMRYWKRYSRDAVFSGKLFTTNAEGKIEIPVQVNSDSGNEYYLEDEGKLTPDEVFHRWRYHQCEGSLK